MDENALHRAGSRDMYDDSVGSNDKEGDGEDTKEADLGANKTHDYHPRDYKV